MDILTIIIVVGSLIYFWGKFWANDTEKNVRTLGEYYQEQLESTKQYYTKFPKASSAKNSVVEYEELIKRLGKSYEKHLHLLEKYRHASIFEQWKLRQDWRLYLQTHKDVQETDMDYGSDLDEKLLQKASDRKDRALIRMEEIEKRFDQKLAA